MSIDARSTLQELLLSAVQRNGSAVVPQRLRAFMLGGPLGLDLFCAANGLGYFFEGDELTIFDPQALVSPDAVRDER